jgi:hypothetical protein
LNEAGIIAAKYRLHETNSRKYWVRTEQNVIDSDGTLILYREVLQGGTAFTERMAVKHRRPCICLDLAIEPDSTEVREWLVRSAICTLNVAGPRESTAPGIFAEALRFLLRVLGE